MNFRIFTLVSALALIRVTARPRDSCLQFLEDTRPNRTITFLGYPATKVSGGLYDRYTIFRALAFLAKSTCSRFYFAPPCATLSNRHNHHKPTSCGLKWSDFLDVSKFADVLLASQPSTPDLTIHNYFKQCYQFTTTSIAVNLPRAPLPLAPPVMLEAKYFIKKRLSSHFIYVHLRLGEDAGTCDQSFPAITKRFSDLKSKLKMSGQHIAISSNYNLPEDFLHSVAEVTKAKVVWLDSILYQFRDTKFSGSNYMMFNLEIAIMKRAMYKITWRRKLYCGDVECIAACRNTTEVFNATPAAACGNTSRP